MFLTGTTHDRSFEVSLYMIADEWSVDKEREPLSGHEEENVEEDVKDVLGQDQRVQAVALVDRVLVVGLQLVKGDYLKVRNN